MMRKTILHGTRHVVTTLLLAAAFLSLALPSDAAPITRKQAEQRAAKFFHKRMARRAAPVQLSLALEKPTDATSAGYYIYNKVGGGYAIVSADDTQAAIIGFSDSGHIDADEMPDNMRWWLDGFYRQATAEEQTDYPDPIAPMLTSQWGQNAPYNLQTPLFSGVHAPAGCGAVAMAQIIRYQQWPDSVGYIPKINHCEELPPTSFDWEKLLDTYADDSPSDCQEEVAKLMRYAGQAIKTSYGITSSTVRASVVADACNSNLRFSDCQYSSRSNYSMADWNNLIYGSLEKGDPVFYSANKNDGGGHAFVCDGYLDGYFHINWGWKGSYDGYFLLSDLSPNSSLNYTRSHHAVLGLHRPDNPAPIDTAFIPSRVIQVKDMVYNPVQSLEGCLTRETIEEAFKGIAIEEERAFTKGALDYTIQYGLALFDNDDMIEVLADTTLDLTNLTTRKQKLTFNISFGSDLENGHYQIKSISRKNQYHPWATNTDGDQLFINADIENNHLNLSYSQTLTDDTYFAIYTGFDSDEKFVTIDETGTPSQSIVIVYNYYNGATTHYYDYGFGLCKGDEIVDAIPLLQQVVSPSTTALKTTYDMDIADLPDGDYTLRGLFRECGHTDWQFSFNDDDVSQKLIKDGNRIHCEVSDTTMCSCTYIKLHVNNTIIKNNILLLNQATNTFDCKAMYDVIGRTPGLFDFGLGLFQNDALHSILTSHFAANRFSHQDSIHINNNLPNGEYVIRGIGRDANTNEWKDVSTSSDSFIYAELRNDTLYVSTPDQYNLRYLEVDSVMFINNELVRAFISNPKPFNINGQVTFIFKGKNDKTYKSRLNVELNKDSSAGYDLSVHLNVEDSLSFSCVPTGQESLLRIAQGIVKPLTMDICFEDFSLSNGDATAMVSDSIFGGLSFSCTARSTTNVKRARLVFRVKGETNNNLWEGYRWLESMSDTYSFNIDFNDIVFHTYTYNDLINTHMHIEMGYERYFCDTLICYTSKDYVFAPYYDIQTYEDNQLQMKKCRYDGLCFIPDEALYVSFFNAAKKGEELEVIPNGNPNTIYLFCSGQQIPETLADRACSDVSYYYDSDVNDLNIIDGFPVTNLVRPFSAQFQLQMNDNEWVLLGCPFIFKSEELEQFDDVMTFDRCEGNTLYFKKMEIKDEWMHSPNILLVRSHEKTVTLSSLKIPTTLDDITLQWGDLQAVKRLIPCHYDLMYQLSPDGSCFRRAEGDVPPFRCVLLPKGDDAPERIKVVIEGYEPTAIINTHHPTPITQYTPDGRAVGSGYHGIVIEVDGNGKARKVVRR